MKLDDYQSVVGLDLSLTSTGIAAYRPEHGYSTTRVHSTGKKSDTWAQRRDRLAILVGEIATTVDCFRSLILVEAPSYASAGAGTHDRSGLWWWVYNALHEMNCTIIPVAPSQRMKYATGVGGGPKASKDAVLAAAVKRYPDIDITGNDVADAVLLMAIGMRLLGQPIETSLPQTHLDALTKITKFEEIA